MARHVSRCPATPDNTNNNRHGGTSQNTYASATQHTPGSQDSVTTEAILARLAKAKEIETSLDTIAKASKRGSSTVFKAGAADEKSQQALRLQLCEVLSDVILNDSTLAHSHDAIGRLWKVCFYGRINDIRSRIMKEKSRAKKRQAGGGGDAAGNGGAEAAKKMVGDLEKQLKQFLKEAIQLYRYIIERYVKELMPLSQSQASALSDLSQQQEDERSLVIIASLYRMHIHLGDLYRYSLSHKQAEECYLKSATLAPGTGNPFNQLAVVAQQSQDSMTVVALYYYARSLMATREPFETSRSNLVRLFESNRKWLDEHSRDEDVHSRGIVNVGSGTEGGGTTANSSMTKKAQKEWMNKERTAMNRKALARIVDLQWAFFRGVSLDGTDGKIDLDGLKKKMALLEETLGDLIGHASFSESLLCKLIAILAFSTLGASNGGKLINADGFYAKRSKNPKWNEGIIMTNQALAFSFFLRLCAVLAKDVDDVLSKKEAANSSHKLGVIRSLSPLLLGFRYATSLYDGECDWFHGLPFFPSKGAAAGKKLESSSIHEMCRESHAVFWKSIASMANHFDSLPTTKKRNVQVYGEVDLVNVKDFAEYHGYVPFTSFLDKNDDDDAMVCDAQNDKTTKYATSDEVIDALSESKHAGGVKGVEKETHSKINLLISIVDGNTCPTSSDDGRYFLTRNAGTNAREFVTEVSMEEEEEEEEEVPEEQTSFDQSPIIPDLDVDNTTGIENVAPGKMSYVTTGMDDAVPLNMSYSEKGMALSALPVPLQMSYSEKGMALLTPAALLAGAVDKPPMTVAVVNNEATKSTSVLPMDSILAMNPAPSNLGTAATKDVDALLNAAFLLKQPQEPPTKAPLPPPPGFSMQAPQTRPQLPPPLAPGMGISLAEFTMPVPPRQAEQNFASFGAGMMPQAGPSYPASSMFETMNPFAQQALPPSFNNDFIAAHSSSGFNQPPGLLNSAQGGVNLQQHGLLNSAQRGVNLQQHTSNNGLDPTLDFLLNNNSTIQSPDELATSNAFHLLVPPAAEPEDPSESILKFLFEPNNSNDTPSPRAGQPLYANQQYSSQRGMPRTKNPFAT